MSNPWYKEYSDFLAEVFPGGKVQKLSVNAGFSCPNRDGTKGRGGCIYCNNRSFSPGYTGTTANDIAAQIDNGRRFFKHKYPQMRYLAYFQSYTGTYAEVDRLLPLYKTAVEPDDVVGLVIGTRPDCMPDNLLEALADMHRNKPVIVEYGVESWHDATLQRINRCHTAADSADAIRRTLDAGLYTGAHLIMGLPGETEDMMLHNVDAVVDTGVHTLKLHQLQILHGTALASQGGDAIATYSLEDYIELCARIVRRLQGRDIVLDRFTASAPADMLIAPRWGVKNHEFVAMLHRRLAQSE